MRPDGCPHSDCARCNGTVAELEKQVAELRLGYIQSLRELEAELRGVTHGRDDIADMLEKRIDRFIRVTDTLEALAAPPGGKA